MRVFFVVQRFGSDIGGGAEAHCRQFALRLAERGHHVEDVTSCARSYSDWANEYEAGTALDCGVTVNRLAVARPRDNELFPSLNGRVMGGRAPLYLQEAWMAMQGPYMPDLVPWIARRAGDFDLAVFFTYLYFTTWAGMPAAAERIPTVLHATAHDEAAFHLDIFDVVLRLPTTFAFSTPEEQALVRRRAGRRSGDVIGVGVDLDVTGDAARFRDAYDLGDIPYLLYLGRLDPGKGADELVEFFATYKQRHPTPLKLVAVGDPVKEFPPHPDIVVTGYVAEQAKRDAIAGCTALVHPSYFESFSMVLTEAWALRRPVLVQGRCDVLVGQARRSGGGIPYTGYSEFEVAVERLLATPELCHVLGQRGRTYTESNYSWPVVMERYEALLERTRRRHAA